MKKSLLSILAAALLLAGCSEPGAHSQGVYMLIDTSGTYAQQVGKAHNILKYLLSQLNPGDTLAVASINTASFSGEDIVEKVTLDNVPSKANVQKRAFNEAVAQYARTLRPSPYTDITGGILQAIEFLNERDPGHKTILVFSDMEEDLKDGYVRDIPLELQGFRVVALNVTKLNKDNVDPRRYMKRLEEWKSKVESGGGKWQVINDLERLDALL